MFALSNHGLGTALILGLVALPILFAVWNSAWREDQRRKLRAAERRFEFCERENDRLSDSIEEYENQQYPERIDALEEDLREIRTRQAESSRLLAYLHLYFGFSYGSAIAKWEGTTLEEQLEIVKLSMQHQSFLEQFPQGSQEQLAVQYLETHEATDEPSGTNPGTHTRDI